MIRLLRPLATIDLETTGVSITEDRIIQIAIRKLSANPGEDGKAHKWLVNPGIPIKPGATEIHKITDEMVKDAPLFSEIAEQVLTVLIGCDILGFNSNYFDCPMLFNEFDRAGFYWDNKTFSMVDAGNLFKIMEPRSLDKAVEFYCNREHSGAHDALVDVDATIDVFAAQLEVYKEILPTTVEELAIFTNYGKRFADLSGKFYYDKEGVLRIAFGQKKDLAAHDCKDYLLWMLSKDFNQDTRAICHEVLNEPKIHQSVDWGPWNDGSKGEDLPF